jgi:hypothetical protein
LSKQQQGASAGEEEEDWQPPDLFGEGEGVTGCDRVWHGRVLQPEVLRNRLFANVRWHSCCLFESHYCGVWRCVCDVWQHTGGLGNESSTAAAAGASGQPDAAAAQQQRPVFTPWGAYNSSAGAGKGGKGGGVSKKGGRPQVRWLLVVGGVAGVAGTWTSVGPGKVAQGIALVAGASNLAGGKHAKW